MKVLPPAEQGPLHESYLFRTRVYVPDAFEIEMKYFWSCNLNLPWECTRGATSEYHPDWLPGSSALDKRYITDWPKKVLAEGLIVNSLLCYLFPVSSCSYFSKSILASSMTSSKHFQRQDGYLQSSYFAS